MKIDFEILNKIFTADLDINIISRGSSASYDHPGDPVEFEVQLDELWCNEKTVVAPRWLCILIEESLYENQKVIDHANTIADEYDDPYDS